MDELMMQGEISTKILTLRGQSVMLDPSTGSGADYLVSVSNEFYRSEVL